MRNLKRRISQIAFLILLGEFSFYGIFRCPFAVPYTQCGSCPVVQCPGKKLWLGFWILLPVSLLLFGRGFCSWACPGGFVSDLISKAALVKGKCKGTAERALSFLKYAALIASITVLIYYDNPRWAIPIRTGDFFTSVKLTFEHADTLWLSRTLIVVAGFSCIILIPHFWCRYCCPTGGMLELFKRVAIFTKVKTEKCNQCDNCRTACPIETCPSETNCTNCGDCNSACPVDAIRVRHK